MSTRSNIAQFNADTGTVTSIYCHHDGYPEGVGATLRGFYLTDDAVAELMALGNISILAMRPAPLIGEAHSFDKRAPDVTVAYTRDRGEPWDDNKPREHGTVTQWLADGLANFGYEHLYIFKDEAWLHVDACALRELLPEDFMKQIAEAASTA